MKRQQFESGVTLFMLQLNPKRSQDLAAAQGKGL
jgi:hypothetical protein